MFIRLFITFTLFFGYSLNCQAMNALRSKAFNSLCPKAKKLEVMNVPEKVEGRKGILTKETFDSVIPHDLKSAQNTNEVRDKIFKKSAESLMKSEMLANTALFKTAKKVEKTTKVDMAVKGKRTSASQQETEHRFNFDVQAFQAKARMMYKGFVDSKVEYRASDDSLIVSLEESLSPSSKIALSHTKDREQTRQLLQYQLTW